MTIQISSTDLKEIRIGTDLVSRVHLGTEVIWPPRPDETVDPAGAYIWDVESYGGYEIEQAIKDAWTTFLNALEADPEGDRYRLTYICILCGHKVPQSTMIQPFVSKNLAWPGAGAMMGSPIYYNASADNVMSDRKYVQVGGGGSSSWSRYTMMKCTGLHSNHPVLSTASTADGEQYAQYMYMRPQPPDPGNGSYNYSVFFRTKFNTPEACTALSSMKYRSWNLTGSSDAIVYGTVNADKYMGWLSFSRRDTSTVFYRESGSRSNSPVATTGVPDVPIGSCEIGSTSYPPYRPAVLLSGFHLTNARERALRDHVQALVDAVDNALSGSYDYHAANYIARVEAADGQPLETAVKDAINQLVVDLKAANAWDGLWFGLLTQGPRTIAGAMCNLKEVSYNGQAVGLTSADYDRVGGLGVRADVDKYINVTDLGRNSSSFLTNKSHFAQIGMLGQYVANGDGRTRIYTLTDDAGTIDTCNGYSFEWSAEEWTVELLAYTDWDLLWMENSSITVPDQVYSCSRNVTDPTTPKVSAKATWGSFNTSVTDQGDWGPTNNFNLARYGQNSGATNSSKSTSYRKSIFFYHDALNLWPNIDTIVGPILTAYNTAITAALS